MASYQELENMSRVGQRNSRSSTIGQASPKSSVTWPWMPSPIGWSQTTPLAVKLALWLVLAVVVAGAIFAFIVGVITFSDSYLTNVHTSRKGHTLFFNVGSGYRWLFWQSDTWFDEIVYYYNMNVRGTIGVDNQLMSIKLWTQNMTSGIPNSLYYSVNSVMDTLTNDVIAATNTVDPVELQAFLNQMFRKREALYTSEFVSYLSLLQSNIVGLQNSTNQILTQNYCHGKPLQAYSTQPVGDMILNAGTNTTLVWGALTQQPSSYTTPYFLSNGTSLISQYKGVFGVSFAANLLVAPNTTGSTTFYVYIDNVPWSQVYCIQTQVNPVSQTFVQCQTAGIMRLNPNDTVSVQASSSAAATLFGWNTRMLLTRAC